VSARTRLASLALLLAGLLLSGCRRGILILSYNVENLFDELAEGGEYPEYRSERWGSELFAAKLAAIARAIRSCCPQGPDVIALQEVESLRALLALRDRHLSSFGYRHAVLVPEPGVVTKVALLSRVAVVRTHLHALGSFEGLPLRGILEAELEMDGRRLVLFNDHWKSKTEGIEKTQPARRRAAQVLVRRIEEILKKDPSADILALGDFNENVEELAEAGGRYLPAFRSAEGGEGRQTLAVEPGVVYLTGQSQQAGIGAGGRLILYEPWYELPRDRWGTSVYRERWQTADHILLSGGLFDRRGFWYRMGGFRVLREPFLLSGPEGFPRRWSFSGSGVSDHLPLLIRLELGTP